MNSRHSIGMLASVAMAFGAGTAAHNYPVTPRSNLHGRRDVAIVPYPIDLGGHRLRCGRKERARRSSKLWRRA